MKPISLKIQAFGPFVEPAVINFNEFKDHRLFLIHGQTGAGKTTIFDAICFALYGNTTFREAIEMRSAFAPQLLFTFVEYIFSIKGKYYYVKREMRLGKDKIDIKPLFYEVDENSCQLSKPLTKITDVNNAIKKIIGFDANQFKQIVILPQGKFDELLRAKSDDKMPVLKEIFGAHLYEKIAENLDQTKKKYIEQTSDIKKDIDRILISTNAKDHGELTEKIKLAELELKNNEAIVPQLDEFYKKALIEYQQADTLSKELEKYEFALKRLNNHLGRSENVSQLKERFHLMEKAETLRLPALALKNLTGEIDKIKKQLSSSKQEITRLSNVIKSLEKEEENNHALQTAIQDNLLQIDKYESLRPKYEILYNRVKEQGGMVADGKEKRQQHLEAKEKLSALLLLIKEYDNEINELGPLEKNKSGLEQSLKRLDEIKKTHSKYIFQLKNLRLAENQLSEVARIYEKAQDKMRTSELEYDQVESLWRKSQSALLAATLIENEPCPVCGSASHPQPAYADGETISDNILNTTREKKKNAALLYDEALTNYSEGEKDHAALRAEVNTLSLQIENYKTKSESELGDEIKKILLESQKAQKAESRIIWLKSEKVILENNIKEQDELREKLEKELDSIEKDYKNIAAKIKELRAEIPDTLTDLHKLNEEIEKIKNNNTSFQTKIEETKSKKELTLSAFNKENGAYEQNSILLQQRVEKFNVEKEIFISQLHDKGFEDEPNLEKYFSNETDRKNLKSDIDDWDNNKLKLETEVQTLKINIQGKERPKVDFLKDESEIRLLALNEVKEKITGFKKDLQLYKKEYENLQILEANFQNLKIEEGHIVKLSEVANGKNEFRQKFESYVLSVFLEEVLVYANKRLLQLSNSRYILMLKEAHGSRKDETLALEVLDNYNNKRRDVQSLSGGETFFTSLALALALADVATAKAGGIRLDAIFIDEGFGTLDAETLDKAIDALISIEGEHRMIGIISHVTELRERIPARLEVIKGKNGSTLRISA